MASNSRQLTCVCLFSCAKHPAKFSINHLNFYCIKQIDYIFLRGSLTIRLRARNFYEMKLTRAKPELTIAS